MRTGKSKKKPSSAKINNLFIVKENAQFNPDVPVWPEEHDRPEKIIQLAGKRFAEKITFSKAIGAYGTFTATNDLRNYTRAKIFSEAGKITKLFTRFSMIGGEHGSTDTERGLKEFSLRFFTEDGDWDIVGNNTPVLFSKDIKKYNEFFHIQKRDTRTNLKDPTRTWDFLSTNPESLHHLIMLMSDRGTPRGYRNMDGYGVHTFSFLNKENEKVWAKFHFKSLQGVKTFTREEAALMRAEDADHAQRDLVETIDKKEFPKWTLSLQIMANDEAKELYFNPFDATKTWSQKQFPLIEAGIIELNSIPENHFKEVQQIEFSISNIIDGISYSPDKMLQGRLFPAIESGENTQHIFPIDEPQKMKHGSFEDIYVNKNYGQDHIHFSTPESWYDYNTSNENDHYTQPGILFSKVLTETERANLIENIIVSMSGIRGPEAQKIVKRQLYHWFRVNEKLGTEIANGLGVNTESILSKEIIKI